MLHLPTMEPLVSTHLHPRSSSTSSRSPSLSSKSDRVQSALTEWAYRAVPLLARELNARSSHQDPRFFHREYRNAPSPPPPHLSCQGKPTGPTLPQLQPWLWPGLRRLPLTCQRKRRQPAQPLLLLLRGQEVPVPRTRRPDTINQDIHLRRVNLFPAHVHKYTFTTPLLLKKQIIKSAVFYRRKSSCC